MRLHLYIARRFLSALLIVVAALVAIYVILDMVEHIRRFGDRISMLEISRLTILNMPGVMYQMLPLMVILATLFLFLNLSRSSEMVVTRAAGRPALITLMAPAVLVFVMGGLGVALMNPIAAATSKEYLRQTGLLSGAKSSAISISSEGFWLRQGDADGQTVIHAEGSGVDGSELVGVSFFSYSTSGLPQSRIDAATARLEDGRWALRDAKIWNLTDSVNPERTSYQRDAYWISSSLTQGQIQDSFDLPTSISIWDMRPFIQQLQKAGFSSRSHRVYLQVQLASPLFLVAMLMIGAAFTMRHTRLGHSGLMAISALISGFGMYFIRNFASILGENGQIPVAIAAWTPPIAALLLALGVILNLEDG